MSSTRNLSIAKMRSPLPGSDRITSPFPRADADDVFDRQDEDLSVADPTGLGGALDRFDDLRDQLVADDDVELHLGQEVDDVLGAAVELGVALLPPESLHLTDRDPLDADCAERLLHLVELEGLDDRLDLLHRELLVGRRR